MPYSVEIWGVETLRAKSAEYARKYRARKLAADPDFYRNANLLNYEKYPKMFAFNALMRMKRVKQATPPWADRQKIKEIYLNTPEGHHVDHQIPLRGELVSGLHVENNLQYLPSGDNIRKSNK